MAWLPLGPPAAALTQSWQVIPSPNVGHTENVLAAVAAISSSNVWAVGDRRAPIFRTLIEHWDGSAWSVIPSPNVGTRANWLNAVAAISSSDVWAVGGRDNHAGTRVKSLIEHWDGSAWNVIPSPNPGPPSPAAGNVLKAVTAISASDVWAAGTYDSGSPQFNATLIEHWNGSAWSVIPSPNTGTSYDLLSALVAVSPSDVWAVGRDGGSPWQTLIEHWDGSAWSVIPSPNAGTSYNELNGVSAVSSSGVWAVGDYWTNRGPIKSLVEHWNGASWSRNATPNPGTVFNELSAVAAVSSSDVWAVGAARYFNGSATGDRTLIEHHQSGTGWSLIPSPNRGGSFNDLYGVAAVSSSDLWAVGAYINRRGNSRTLIEHYS